MTTERGNILSNPGPVNLDPAIKAHLFDVEYCHRQPEFLSLYERTRARLHQSLDYPSSTFRLGLLHGSGTLAVDAALASFVRGRVVVIDNGLYCRRIARTLDQLGVADVELVEHRLGDPIDLDRVRSAVARSQPDWIGFVHHETTTGILNPLSEVAAIASEFGVRLFVDAVSSIGAHELGQAGDVVCFNSSKCLEAVPGIAGVFWRDGLDVYPTVSALDVPAYSDGMASTPNVQAFVSLDVALGLLEAEDRPARYERLARAICMRGERDFELFLPPEHRSNVLTSFRLGGQTIEQLEAKAASHGLVIYPGQAALRDEIFRVANMGAAINEALIDELFSVLT